MMRHAKRFLHIVDDAKSRIKETVIEDVKARAERGEPFYLVDVREESEWNKGHITNAIYIGKGVIERDIEKTITNMESEIILYCGGGFRSALAADSLQKKWVIQMFILWMVDIVVGLKPDIQLKPNSFLLYTHQYRLSFTFARKSLTVITRHTGEHTKCSEEKGRSKDSDPFNT